MLQPQQNSELLTRSMDSPNEPNFQHGTAKYLRAISNFTLSTIHQISQKITTVIWQYYNTHEVTTLQTITIVLRLWVFLGLIDIPLSILGYPSIVIPLQLAKIKYYIVAYILSKSTHSRARQAVLIRDNNCKQLESLKGGVLGSWRHMFKMYKDSRQGPKVPDYISVRNNLAVDDVSTGALWLGFIDAIYSEDPTVVKFVMRHMVEVFTVWPSAIPIKKALFGEGCCAVVDGKEWQLKRRMWLTLMLRDAERDGQIALKYGELFTETIMVTGTRHDLNVLIRRVLGCWLTEHL